MLELIFLSHMTLAEHRVWSLEGLMGLKQAITAASEPVEILSAHIQSHVTNYTLFASGNTKTGT